MHYIMLCCNALIWPTYYAQYYANEKTFVSFCIKLYDCYIIKKWWFYKNMVINMSANPVIITFCCNFSFIPSNSFPSRGGWTHSHALFITLWFPYISIYTSRQLNVIDYGKIVLVITKIWWVTQGYLLQAALNRQYHMMYIPLHNMSLSTTVLAENDRATLSKESEMKTLSNLKDA